MMARPVILLVDTYEELEGWDDWFCRSLIPALPAGVKMIFLGRNNLHRVNFEWEEFEADLRTMPLPELGEAEARSYLQHYGLSDPTSQEQVIAFTGGYPLLLVLVRHLAQEHGGWDALQGLERSADRDHIATELLKRILREERTQELRAFLEQGVVARWFNPEIIGVILELNAADSRAVTLMALGSLYHKQHRLAEAEQVYADAVELAQTIGNQRILTHAHINLARLAMLQSQPDVALPHLDQAEASALALDYHEALGDVAQLRGDILLWQGEADSVEVARQYAIALAHAVDFNQITLHQRLDYLAGLLTAIAADGDRQGAQAVAAGIQQAWQQLTPGPPQQQILDFFEQLLTNLDRPFPVHHSDENTHLASFD